MSDNLQALVQKWREEAQDYKAQPQHAPGLAALAMGHEECASELEAALAADTEARAELERKAAWYDAHVREGGDLMKCGIFNDPKMGSAAALPAKEGE